jgi:hypothetical protein
MYSCICNNILCRTKVMPPLPIWNSWTVLSTLISIALKKEAEMLRPEVLTAVTRENIAFWDVTQLCFLLLAFSSYTWTPIRRRNIPPEIERTSSRLQVLHTFSIELLAWLVTWSMIYAVSMSEAPSITNICCTSVTTVHQSDIFIIT